MQASTSNSLPIWAQYFTLAATLVLSGLRAWEFFRKPTLSVALTKDVFFRVIDFGEALFCNAILMAERGPVLVTHVSAVLKKTDQPLNTFPLDIIQFGEKVKTESLLAEHFFYTSSPLAHIP